MKPFRTLLPLLALLPVSGCGPAPDAGTGPVTLHFWNGFSGPDGATMEKIVRGFNESHPDIKVQMQIIPWATYYDKVTLGLAFGGAPEVFILHATRIPEYAENNALATWDEDVKAGKWPVEDFKERPWKASQFNGHQVGIPLDCHPLGLYYNLDLFAKAGISKPPTTYEEFIEAGKKLTIDKDGDGIPDQWGFAFTNLSSNGIAFLNAYGASFLSPDLSKAAFNTPEARQAVDRMQAVWRDEKIAPRPEGQDAWMGFLTGRVAMAMEGVYMKAGLDKQEGLRYAAAPVPRFGPREGVWGGSHILCMPAGLSGRRRDAAAKFIRYLSDHSVAWAEGGQVPVRKSLLATKEFNDLPVQREFAKQLDEVVYEPPSPLFNQLAPFGNAALEAIVNNLEPIDVALKKADRRIDAVLERR